MLLYERCGMFNGQEEGSVRLYSVVVGQMRLLMVFRD